MGTGQNPMLQACFGGRENLAIQHFCKWTKRKVIH